MVRLKDVAAAAGVTPSTASRALRGDPTQRVGVETRQRIIDAARDLGYRANYLGRSLRTQRTGTIGLLVPNLDLFTFVEVTHGVQAAAIESDHSLLIVEVDQFRRRGARAPHELVYQRLVEEGRVDGMVVGSATLDDDVIGSLAARAFPLVLVNRRGDGQVPSVTCRDEDAAMLVVEHLVGLGHRRIASVNVDVRGGDAGARRRAGLWRGLERHGLEHPPDYHLSSSMSDEGGRDAIQALFERTVAAPPTAIFLASLTFALGALEAIRDRGLRVPEDVSLLGFPDHSFARHTNPPLSTVAVPMRRMGEEAGRLLLRLIGGADVTSVQLPDPPHFVERGSTAPPRLDP
ncbi:MAG: LacI family transcriptional regulator [Chloroflexi bacterium]|nr:LacI family transcriptional regulator [Chloroflexota bacterium]